jgi:FkbM family methyltransferase
VKPAHLPVAAALLLAACGAQPASTRAARTRPSFEVQKIVPRELLREANHGREIEGPDSRYVVPGGVRRVWIDVGAHLLESSRTELETHDDVAVVAIEPLAECWKTWPANPRLTALPVAISLERGWLDFNVNAANITSSLLKTVEGNEFDALTHTVEVRKVPVIRLEDVLERIPPEIEIEFLETDVQGLDLQVLKSAGEQLRRVKRVQAEVINDRIYDGSGALRPGTETEFVDFMAGKGFQFVGDTALWEHRAWLDKQWVNPERMGWLWRARRRIRSLFS